MKLIECVPNFSEGRDRAVIDAITAEIAATTGAVLLDVDPGAATNRTVVTFLGGPEAVEEAAFRAIRQAAASPRRSVPGEVKSSRGTRTRASRVSETASTTIANAPAAAPAASGTRPERRPRATDSAVNREATIATTNAPNVVTKSAAGEAQSPNRSPRP